MTYPTILMHAVQLAAQWHEGQLRKHPTERIPYITHPVSVALLLQQQGCDEETVAAGLLHDVIEDCGVTLEELASKTSPRIADLVSWVTEPIKSTPWSVRKEAYRERLSGAPHEALMVAAADHVCNLHSLVDAAEVSAEIWQLFKSDRNERIAHEHLVLEILEQRLDPPLVMEFKRALADVERLASSVV